MKTGSSLEARASSTPVRGPIRRAKDHPGADAQRKCEGDANDQSGDYRVLRVHPADAS